MALVAAVVVALVAFALVDRSPARAPHYTTQLSGYTSEGIAMWALERDGAIRTVRIVWRGGCWNGGESWATLREPTDKFRRAGRTFTVSAHFPTHDTRPRGARVVVTVGGELARDGRSATGTIRGRVTWPRHGRAGPTCVSPAIRWRLRSNSFH